MAFDHMHVISPSLSSTLSFTFVYIQPIFYHPPFILLTLTNENKTRRSLAQKASVILQDLHSQQERNHGARLSERLSIVLLPALYPSSATDTRCARHIPAGPGQGPPRCTQPPGSAAQIIRRSAVTPLHDFHHDGDGFVSCRRSFVWRGVLYHVQ